MTKIVDLELSIILVVGNEWIDSFVDHSLFHTVELKAKEFSTKTNFQSYPEERRAKCKVDRIESYGFL